MRVEFASPAEGATVPHIVAVAADVIGGRDPIVVTFSAERVAPAQVGEPPFLTNLDLSSNGNTRIELVATAIDVTGQVARAHRRVVVDRGLLARDALPKVALLAPTGRLLCGATGVVAEASDDKALASLALYLDGAMVAAGQSPLRWPWDTTGSPDGEHVLKAIARDDKGQLASTTLSVTVDNARGVCDQPPSIMLTSPDAARPVRGEIALAAAAQDDVAVVKVAFSVDGTALTSDDVPPYEARWDSRRAPDGPHTLQAVATDSAALTAEHRLQVQVDNTAPALAFVAPVEGNRVSGMVTVSLDARDPGGIASVDLRALGPDGNERALGSRTAGPFTFTWDTSAAMGGAYRLTATARDVAGNETTTSAGVILGGSRGTVCAADTECESGFCTDGVCCGSRCDEACRTCASPGQAGECTPITAGADAPRCAGLQACGPGGACLKLQGQPCTKPQDCLEGFCADGFCCTSACDGACMTCKKPGDEGRCQTGPVGPDPGTCEGAMTCDNRGACKKVAGQACQDSGECSSGNCQQQLCCPDTGCGATAAAPTNLGTGVVGAPIGGVAAMPDGRIVVVGGFWDPLDFDPGPGVTSFTPQRGDTYVAVYRTDLSLEWVRVIGGAGQQGWPLGVAVGPDGGIVVAGLYTGETDLDPGPGVVSLTTTGGDYDYAAYWVKLSAKGDYVWGRTLKGPKYIYLQYMAGGPDGTTAVGGSGKGSVTFAGEGVASQTFPVTKDYTDVVASLDYDGNLRFVTVTDHEFVLSPRPAVAADGSVVYGGRIQEDIDVEPGPGTTTLINRGSADGFLIKLDRTGKYAWARQIAGPDLDGEPIPFIAPDGTVYATGVASFDVIFDPSDPQRPIPEGRFLRYVMKMGSDNTYGWTRVIPSAGDVQSIGFLPDGNLLLAGSFSGAFDLDAGPGQFLVKEGGLYLTSWSPDSLFRWGLSFGGKGSGSPVGILRADGDQIIVVSPNSAITRFRR